MTPEPSPAFGHAGRVLTGMCHIDDVLGGGIPLGVIIDIFGRHGTGKTQMLHYVATGFARHGRRVLYVDTAGTFRPERILQMAPTKSNSRLPDMLLGMISVARIQNVSEQIAIADRLLRNADGFDLVIVDSLTDLFIYEYSRYGDLQERNRTFFRYMRSLARLAVRNHITIMTSNMVRASKSGDSESMAAEVDLFAHVKIHLAKTEDSLAAGGLEGRVLCAMRDGPSDGSAGSDCTRRDGRDARASVARGDSGGQESDIIFSYKILSTGIETDDVLAVDEFDLP